LKQRAAALALGMACCVPSKGAVAPLPKEWARLPGAPSLEALQCAAFGDRWMVERSGSEIAIRHWIPLEESVPPPFEMPNGVDAVGVTRSTRVDDGWLVGFDAGEFGGGLWWIAPDREQFYSLDPSGNLGEVDTAPVQGFTRFAGRLLVFRGLDHLGSAQGAVFTAAQVGSRWGLQPVLELDGEPLGWVERGPTLLVLTASAVWSLDRELKGAVLVAFPKEWPYPTSIAVGPQEWIWLGMPRYVASLGPTSDGWNPSWYVRVDCLHATLVDNRCVCTPQ